MQLPKYPLRRRCTGRAERRPPFRNHPVTPFPKLRNILRVAPGCRGSRHAVSHPRARFALPLPPSDQYVRQRPPSPILPPSLLPSSLHHGKCTCKCSRISSPLSLPTTLDHSKRQFTPPPPLLMRGRAASASCTLQRHRPDHITPLQHPVGTPHSRSPGSLACDVFFVYFKIPVVEYHFFFFFTLSLLEIYINIIQSSSR